MITYIALLRGINVGGKKKVPMAELRQCLAEIGFKNIQTYIQSGNIIFQSSEENNIVLEKEIQKIIASQFRFEVPVLVKNTSDFKQIFNACPFSEEKKETSYFTLLHNVPDENLIASLINDSSKNDEFFITNSCVYLSCKSGYGKTKFNNNFFEKKLNVIATTRNYKTMAKLLSLSAD